MSLFVMSLHIYIYIYIYVSAYILVTVLYVYMLYLVVDVFVSFVSLGQWYLIETTQERFGLVVPKVSACHAVEGLM